MLGLTDTGPPMQQTGSHRERNFSTRLKLFRARSLPLTVQIQMYLLVVNYLTSQCDFDEIDLQFHFALPCLLRNLTPTNLRTKSD